MPLSNEAAGLSPAPAATKADSSPAKVDLLDSCLVRVSVPSPPPSRRAQSSAPGLSGRACMRLADSEKPRLGCRPVAANIATAATLRKAGAHARCMVFICDVWHPFEPSFASSPGSNCRCSAALVSAKFFPNLIIMQKRNFMVAAASTQPDPGFASTRPTCQL